MISAMKKAIERARDYLQREPMTHDYSTPAWGHSVTIIKAIDSGRMRAAGFGRGIEIDDYLILPGLMGPMRWRVFEIKYMHDPKDQWFATIGFAPQCESCGSTTFTERADLNAVVCEKGHRQ